jgi:RNase P/RNase MRP subunit p29
MEFESFLGKIVKIETERHDLPLFGRLLHETDEFLKIEKRNGLLVVVRKDQVRSIAATYRQPEGA